MRTDMMLRQEKICLWHPIRRVSLSQIPVVLEKYGTSAHKKLHELGVAAGVAMADESHEAGAEKFITAIRELNKKMNIPEHFEGIKEEDIPLMARHAAKEANPLYPVPKLMSARELEGFYYEVMKR